MGKGQLQALDEGGRGGLGWGRGDGRAQVVASRWALEWLLMGVKEEVQEQPRFGVAPQTESELGVLQDPPARSGPCLVLYPGGGFSGVPGGTDRAACGGLPRSEHIPAGDKCL